MSVDTAVECCLRNVDREGYRLLLSSDCEVEYQHCLGHCGRCRSDPNLIFDGQLRHGPHDELVLAEEGN